MIKITETIEWPEVKVGDIKQGETFYGRWPHKDSHLHLWVVTGTRKDVSTLLALDGLQTQTADNPSRVYECHKVDVILTVKEI